MQGSVTSLIYFSEANAPESGRKGLPSELELIKKIETSSSREQAGRLRY